MPWRKSRRAETKRNRRRKRRIGKERQAQGRWKQSGEKQKKILMQESEEKRRVSVG
jgi:hypothetical protein